MLPGVAFEQSQRIAALQGRYQVHFEESLNAATSTNNYEYLDILDRAWADSGLARPEGGVVCDKDGHSRVDYAAGYVGRISGARFLVAAAVDVDPGTPIRAYLP